MPSGLTYYWEVSGVPLEEDVPHFGNHWSISLNANQLSHWSMLVACSEDKESLSQNRGKLNILLQKLNHCYLSCSKFSEDFSSIVSWTSGVSSVEDSEDDDFWEEGFLLCSKVPGSNVSSTSSMMDDGVTERFLGFGGLVTSPIGFSSSYSDELDEDDDFPSVSFGSTASFGSSSSSKAK